MWLDYWTARLYHALGWSGERPARRIMRYISESKAIARLELIRRDFARAIADRFEHKAKPCSQCETPGACCLDEHFVNVRISRLEAVAIKRALSELPENARAVVANRTNTSIEKYSLHGTDEKYACPLYEKGMGCLVHHTAKPLPCIAHACYERKEDLPPDELLATREMQIAELNRRVYGRTEAPLPIPIAIGITTDPKPNGQASD